MYCCQTSQFQQFHACSKEAPSQGLLQMPVNMNKLVPTLRNTSEPI